MATRPRKGKELRPVVPSPLTRSPSVGRLAFRHRAQSIIGSKALDELELEVSEGLLCEPSEVESGSKYSLIAAEVFYSSIWWSVVQTFSVTLLVNQKKQTLVTLQSFILAWLSPLILYCIGMPPFQRHSLLIVRLLTLVGVLSPSAPCSFTMLLVLAVSNSFAVLSIVGSWWDVSGLDQFRKVYCHLVGYCLFLILKIYGLSPLPQSLSDECLCSFFGCASVVYMWWSEQETPVFKAAVNNDNLLQLPGVFPTTLAFGGLLFLTHVLLGHLGAVSVVAMVGFPEPYQSIFVLFLCLLTLVILSDEDFIVGHFAWSAIACIGCLLFILTKSLPGYFGGILSILFIISAWPLLCSRICLQSYNLVPISLLVHFSLLSGFVWISSPYNLWLLMLSMVVVAFGIRTWWLGDTDVNTLHNHTFFLGRIMNKLPTSSKLSVVTHSEVFMGEDCDREQIRLQTKVEMLASEDHEYHMFFRKITICMIVLLLLSAVGAFFIDADVTYQGMLLDPFQRQY